MMICERCGCDDRRACHGGCCWVAPNLCSRCSVILLREVGEREAADQLDSIMHVPTAEDVEFETSTKKSGGAR